MILLCCMIGVYSVNGSVFDLYVMIAFGLAGYLMKKFGFEPAPLVLAYVLGPMLENNFRKALILSRGDMTTFVTKPISAVCLGLAALLRSEEHTSELQSLMRISYAVFCLKKKKKT